MKELATNQQVLENLDKLIKVDIGHVSATMDNGTFYISISCGVHCNLSSIDECNKTKSFAEYKELFIEIFDHVDVPEPERKLLTDWKPFTFETNGQTYSIDYNVKIFPHTPTIVRYDERFKEQPWAEKFQSHSCEVTPDILCDILRYCQKISNLKAFW